MWVDIIIFILLIGALAFSSYFLAKSSEKTKEKYLTDASIVGWVGLSLLVIVLIMYMIFGMESASMTGGIFTTIMVYSCIAVIITTAVLGFLGTFKIDRKDRKKPMIGSCVVAGAALVFIIWKIVGFALRHHHS